MKSRINYALVLVCLILASCSDDTAIENQESVNTKDDLLLERKITPANYDHVISYGDVDAGIKDNVTEVFIDDQLVNQVEYIGDLGYNVVEYTDKYRVVNDDDSNEYFEIYNVRELSDKIVFDVKTTDGNVLPDFEYSYENKLPCPWCWVAGAVITVVEVIADTFNETECQTAINACVAAGGLPSTQITNGLFSSSCSVTCNTNQ